MLKPREQHHSLRDSVSGFGCRGKVRNAEWCLAEAIREDTRAFLRKATSLALLQDARSPRLLLRFSASQPLPPLAFRKGYLGHIHQAAGDAADIARGTQQILRRFCTRRLGSGRGGYDFDEALYDHLLVICEMWVTDAASDERTAGEALRTPAAVLSATHATMPNIMVIQADITHGLRRARPQHHGSRHALSKAQIVLVCSCVRVHMHLCSDQGDSTAAHKL